MHEAVKSAVRRAEFRARDDWGGFLATDDYELVEEMEWECTSCRPETGWAKGIVLFFPYDKPVDEIRVEIACGHCGTDYEYDAELDLVETR